MCFTPCHPVQPTSQSGSWWSGYTPGLSEAANRCLHVVCSLAEQWQSSALHHAVSSARYFKKYIFKNVIRYIFERYHYQRNKPKETNNCAIPWKRENAFRQCIFIKHKLYWDVASKQWAVTFFYFTFSSQNTHSTQNSVNTPYAVFKDVT